MPMQVIITQEPGKPMHIEVVGAEGTECTKATKALDKLGPIVDTQYKPEYYKGSPSSNINLGI